MRSEETGGKVLEHWTPEDVAGALARREIVLIDVRTPAEYMMEHVRGALLAPMAGFDAAAMPDEGSKRIVFHCGSGIRSRKMAEAWLEAGHDRAAHLEGGFGAWKAAKLPYVGIDPATGGPKDMPG